VATTAPRHPKFRPVQPIGAECTQQLIDITAEVWPNAHTQLFKREPKRFRQRGANQNIDVQPGNSARQHLDRERAKNHLPAAGFNSLTSSNDQQPRRSIKNGRHAVLPNRNGDCYISQAAVLNWDGNFHE
jgi:hypothetical protein